MPIVFTLHFTFYMILIYSRLSSGFPLFHLLNMIFAWAVKVESCMNKRLINFGLENLSIMNFDRQLKNMSIGACDYRMCHRHRVWFWPYCELRRGTLLISFTCPSLFPFTVSIHIVSLEQFRSCELIWFLRRFSRSKRFAKLFVGTIQPVEA